jgi:hypothetical protein
MPLPPRSSSPRLGPAMSRYIVSGKTSEKTKNLTLRTVRTSSERA